MRPNRFICAGATAVVALTLVACAGPALDSDAQASNSVGTTKSHSVSTKAVAAPPVTLSDEIVWAITAEQQLIQFRAIQPERLLQQRPVIGLATGEIVLGMAFGHRQTLYVWSSAGRLYTLDTNNANLRLVSPRHGSGVQASNGVPHGMDFDPIQNQLRVIDASGRNLRLNPDTGIVVDTDPQRVGIQTDGRLVFAQRDWNAETTPELVAIAHQFNALQHVSTTFAIDRRTGTLVSQGSREGVRPVVSPNFGRLYTVGSLGLDVLQDAALDIASRSHVALAAIRIASESRVGLYQIDLSNGSARWLGMVGENGIELYGLAIQPD